MIHLITLLAWQDLFNFENYAELLPLVRNSIIAGAFLGVVGGVVGVLVMTRDLPFAVHGISELSFAGASGALLFGASVTGGAFVGSVAAALLIGLLGMRARDRNSIIGVIMPFGLGLGILFLSLYQGRAANKFGLLTGQVVAIDNTSLRTLVITSIAILAVLGVVWRPLMFSSIDPVMATARGVPVRFLGLLFMLVLGCAIAISVQVVGALLILALLVTPAAAVPAHPLDIGPTVPANAVESGRPRRAPCLDTEPPAAAAPTGGGARGARYQWRTGRRRPPISRQVR